MNNELELHVPGSFIREPCITILDFLFFFLLLMWSGGKFHNWGIYIIWWEHFLWWSSFFSCIIMVQDKMLYNAWMLDHFYISLLPWSDIDEDSRRWMVHFIHQNGMQHVWLALTPLIPLPGKSTKRSKR